MDNASAPKESYHHGDSHECIPKDYDPSSQGNGSTLISKEARQDFIDFTIQEEFYWFMLCPTEVGAEEQEGLSGHFSYYACNDYMHRPEHLTPLKGAVTFLRCDTLPMVEINKGPEFWGIDYGYDDYYY